MSDKQPNLDSLSLAALEIESPQKRAAFLTQACGGDLSLQSEVEQLLHSHQEAGSFLDQPATELGATIPPDLARQGRAAALEAGLAAAFPAEAAVVIGDASHSVLKALEKTVDVPRVVLREGVESHGSQTQMACSALISYREGQPADAIEWTNKMPNPRILTLE